ncbi:hypothetical protein [Limnoglobus roseus]|uniref:Uncharacterized protein n=1 Tax=Limnoglobus roseus TaxID=2598579 RepID=A0A5C1AGB2_9BACT|nr:hypothetical protein [Limnoglobus roseus]QEL16782.1 hypothetical protein PX52LOC_03755 [Limnoglobus roseus]
MPHPEEFDFEELAELIYPQVSGFYAEPDAETLRRVLEDGLTLEQAAGLVIGDTIQVYTQEKSATEGIASSFILNPDWRHVRDYIADMLHQVFVSHLPQFQAEAGKRQMPMHDLAAGIVVAAVKKYLQSGEKEEVNHPIPEQHHDLDIGL